MGDDLDPTRCVKASDIILQVHQRAHPSYNRRYQECNNLCELIQLTTHLSRLFPQVIIIVESISSTYNNRSRMCAVWDTRTALFRLELLVLTQFSDDHRLPTTSSTVLYRTVPSLPSSFSLSRLALPLFPIDLCICSLPTNESFNKCTAPPQDQQIQFHISYRDPSRSFNPLNFLESLALDGQK